MFLFLCTACLRTSPPPKYMALCYVSTSNKAHWGLLLPLCRFPEPVQSKKSSFKEKAGLKETGAHNDYFEPLFMYMYSNKAPILKSRVGHEHCNHCITIWMKQRLNSRWALPDAFGVWQLPHAPSSWLQKVDFIISTLSDFWSRVYL